MANIRIIEIEQSELTPEQLAIINAGGVVFDETSQWKYTSSTTDLVPSAQLVGRGGMWTASFNLNLAPEDLPPTVQWTYESAEDVVDLSIANEASRAHLRIRNIDLTPNPSQFHPDSFWQRNGQDIIPRSS
tara:strand:- start:4177 stop:4569 length:393 start_codon:yes stop_codon:yes gene_type:complete